MSYFRNFPLVDYNFGNEISPALFQNLTTYVDLVDRVSEDISVYETYTIMDGERPDSLSYKLYGSTDYYWTFYFLNESLRRQGWPIGQQEVYTLGAKYYPNTVVSTKDALTEIDNDSFNKFYLNDIVATRDAGSPGSNPSFANPGFKGRLLEKNLDLGQLTIEPIIEIRSISITNGGSGYTTTPTITISGGDGTGATVQAVTLSSGVITSILLSNKGSGYTAAPTITISDPDTAGGTTATATATLSSNTLPEGTTLYSFIGVEDTDLWGTSNKLKSINADSVVTQLNAVHHYEDADGNWVDLPVYGSGFGVNITAVGTSGKTPVTYLERLRSENDALAQIKVFKRSMVDRINTEFQKQLRV
tara:strand:+ start:8909 stop:9991 length:1083 start_codon:yes stop_codon:yes gene_type:complete